MQRSRISLLLFFLLFCSGLKAQHAGTPDFDVHLSGKSAFLSIKFDADKTEKGNLKIKDVLVEEDFIKSIIYHTNAHQIPIAPGKYYTLEVKLVNAQIIKLLIEPLKVPVLVFMAPGETSEVNISTRSPRPLDTDIRFSGAFADINNFLIDYNLLFSEYNSKNKLLASSGYSEKLAFLEEKKNHNKIPEWFYHYFYDKINYTQVNDILKNKPGSEAEETLHIKNLPLDNPLLKSNPVYFTFLANFIAFEFKKVRYTYPFYQQFLAFAEKELSEPVKQTIYQRLLFECDSQHLVHTDIKNIIKSRITDKGFLEYFHNREIFKALPAGTQAPDFELIDSLENVHKLADYKGKVVLLAFWFDRCGPCIREFPAENELVEKYKNEDFALISLCVNSRKEDWQWASRRYGLKTINLYADEKADQKLIRN